MDAQTAVEQSQVSQGRFTLWARLPFAVAALGGGVFLVALKYVGLHQAWVTLVAVALIFGYTALVYYVPKLRLREDQLADNCYYLGFLYTLISLSFALWEFARYQNEADIVANFGLALASTITGIVLRVTINQARKEVVETEIDARMELAQSVVRLRTQIDDAVLAIASFHQTTQQIASDAIRKAADETLVTLSGSVQQVGAASSGAMTKVDEAFKEFTEHASQLNTISAGTVRGMKSLLSRIEKIEAPADLIVARLEPVFMALDDAAERLRARVEAEDELVQRSAVASDKITKSARELSDGFAAIRHRLEETAQASGSAQDAANRLGGTLEDVVRLSLDANKLAAEAEAGMATTIGVFKSHNDRLAGELNKMRTLTSETGNTIVSLIEELSSSLESGGHSELRPMQGLRDTV